MQSRKNIIGFLHQAHTCASAANHEYKIHLIIAKNDSKHQNKTNEMLESTIK